MTHATRRWSYSTGERGRNRVRVFEHHGTGTIFLELREAGRRKRIALPTLDEVLEAIPKGIGVNVEIKDPRAARAR